MNNVNQSDRTERQLGGRDILAILWRGRISLIVITFTITTAVAVTAHFLPARYDATVLLMPVSDMDAPDRGSATGSAGAALGGLASLAGLSSGGNSLKMEALAIVESEALTDRFIQANDLLPVLYPDRWDAARKQWKTKDPKQIPTLWKASRLFHGVRTVVDNPRTGLIALTIKWRDPYQAAQWANDLVSMTNEYLRNNAINEAERSIAFLQGQAKRADFVAIQEAISSLTESQLKKAMLARTREQYALKVLDPATVPERQSFPRPVLWTAAAFAGSLFLGVLFVLVRASDTAPLANASPQAGKLV